MNLVRTQTLYQTNIAKCTNFNPLIIWGGQRLLNQYFLIWNTSICVNSFCSMNVWVKLRIFINTLLQFPVSISIVTWTVVSLFYRLLRQTTWFFLICRQFSDVIKHKKWWVNIIDIFFFIRPKLLIALTMWGSSSFDLDICPTGNCWTTIYSTDVQSTPPLVYTSWRHYAHFYLAPDFSLVS